MSKKEQKKNKPSSAQSHNQRNVMLAMYAEAVANDAWVSQISGEPLPLPPTEQEVADPKLGALVEHKWNQFFSCFSHLISKQKYPEVRALDSAIWLVTPEEHDLWGNNLQRALNIKGPIGEAWRKKFDARQALLKDLVAGKYSRWAKFNPEQPSGQ